MDQSTNQMTNWLKIIMNQYTDRSFKWIVFSIIWMPMHKRRDHVLSECILLYIYGELYRLVIAQKHLLKL